MSHSLAAVYAKVPTLECKPGCHDCCGPVPATRLERRAVHRAVRETPHLHPLSLDCPVLRDSRCGAYAVRPLICRLFGTVRKMACPHGIEPSRWLTQDEAHALLREASEIGGASSIIGL